MAALRALMRLFSYAFHALLALFLLGLALVALSSHQTLQLGMLPWQGPSLTYWLLGAALVGLILVFLAIGRRVRWLYFFWTVAVLLVLARGYFFTGYYFRELPAFHSALYLTAGALIGVFGAWFQVRREPLR